MKFRLPYVIFAFGLCAANAHAATPADLHGSVASPSHSSRTIIINEAVKHINVHHQETVTLVCGSSRATWRFDGVHSVISSATILPTSSCKKQVPIYVEFEAHG